MSERKRVHECVEINDEYMVEWDIPGTDGTDADDNPRLVGAFYIEPLTQGFMVCRKRAKRREYNAYWYYLSIEYNEPWRPENENEFKQTWLDLVRARCPGEEDLE